MIYLIIRFIPLSRFQKRSIHSSFEPILKLDKNLIFQANLSACGNEHLKWPRPLHITDGQILEQRKNRTIIDQSYYIFFCNVSCGTHCVFYSARNEQSSDNGAPVGGFSRHSFCFWLHGPILFLRNGTCRP